MHGHDRVRAIEAGWVWIRMGPWAKYSTSVGRAQAGVWVDCTGIRDASVLQNVADCPGMPAHPRSQTYSDLSHFSAQLFIESACRRGRSGWAACSNSNDRVLQRDETEHVLVHIVSPGYVITIYIQDSFRAGTTVLVVPV